MDPLLARFLELAAEAPGAPALMGPGGSASRGEVAAKVRSLGLSWQQTFAARGIDAGAVIALYVPTEPDFLVAFLACRMAGACVLALDASLTEEEQRQVSATLGARCRWRADGASTDSTLAADSIDWLDGSRQLPKAACLLLTSGSSGEPVGVAVSGAALVADGRALIHSMGLRAEDRILASIPLSHAYGLSVIATPAWLLGCAVVTPARGRDLEAAEEYRATVWPSVPSWYEAHLAAAHGGRLPTSLRLMISAGAPLRPRTARAWNERYGSGIHVLYGSSECGGISYDRQGDAAARGSVGSAVEGVRIELDGQGSVTVYSEAVAEGYVPGTALRDTRITQGCFQTDDMAHFEGDELFLDGRKSDWINIKGKKVNPHEVEGVLAQHPKILDVAVLARALPDDRGEAIRAVIACADGSLRFRDVVEWCRPRLARHKYPRSVVLVRNLPRNERGKLDKCALRDL